MEEECKFPGFRDRLRRAATEAGLKTTQKSLGAEFGVSDIGARHWWLGEKLPGMANAIRIAERLDVCVEWLLTGRGPKRPLPDETSETDPRTEEGMRIAGIYDQADDADREKLRELAESIWQKLKVRLDLLQITS